MSDKIHDEIAKWSTWIVTALMSLVVWLGGGMLGDIKASVKESAVAQQNTTARLSAIEEKLNAGSATSIYQSAQIEKIRTEVIDLRMRVNTIEDRQSAASVGVGRPR